MNTSKLYSQREQLQAKVRKLLSQGRSSEAAQSQLIALTTRIIKRELRQERKAA